jgi:hypothetical protein
MTSTSAKSVGPLSANIVHRGAAGAGPFMLTLCRLVEPVSIRPPQLPHLRPFTFFTTRTRQRDGSEQLKLHMGFFETLADAEKWARAVRGRHPEAIAGAAPRALWQLPDSAEPVWQSVQSVQPQGGTADCPPFIPVDNPSLTDTQVLNILETRQPASGQNGSEEKGGEQIEMLRPDDTVIRHALKEAVAKGMPVSFAVQLHWSARPIDMSRVPALSIFKAYSLYALESRSANRSCFFLRLGFFGDPISAKQVAAYVRSSFGSAAVVPVLDEEITLAREACTETSLIPSLLRQRLDHAPELGGKPESRRRRASSKGGETLEQTLAQLAERELLNDPDLLSDTGVRHLRVEIEKSVSGGRH